MPPVTIPPSFGFPVLEVPVISEPDPAADEDYWVDAITSELKAGYTSFGEVQADKEQKILRITPKDPGMTQQVIDLYGQRQEIQLYWQSIREAYQRTSDQIGLVLPGYRLVYTHPADPAWHLLEYVDGRAVYDFTDDYSEEAPPLPAPGSNASLDATWSAAVLSALQTTYEDVARVNADLEARRFILFPKDETIRQQLTESYAQDPALQQTWADLKEGLRRSSLQIRSVLPGFTLAYADPETEGADLLAYRDGALITDYTDELPGEQPDLAAQDPSVLTQKSWIEAALTKLKADYEDQAQVYVFADEKMIDVRLSNRGIADLLAQYDTKLGWQEYWRTTRDYFAYTSRQIEDLLPGYRLLLAYQQDPLLDLLQAEDGAVTFDFFEAGSQILMPQPPTGQPTEDDWFEYIAEQELIAYRPLFLVEANLEGKEFRFIAHEYALVTLLNQSVETPQERGAWTEFADGMKAVSDQIRPYLPGFAVTVASPLQPERDLLKIQDGVIVYDHTLNQ